MQKFSVEKIFHIRFKLSQLTLANHFDASFESYFFAFSVKSRTKSDWRNIFLLKLNMKMKSKIKLKSS